MKNLNQYIQEKYLIDDHDYSDEELRNDYNNVQAAITKAEKKSIADKYGFKDIRTRPIQLGILDLLKENRQKKKEFNDDDITDFLHLDIKDKEYEKYLDEEPIEFVKVLFDSYKKSAEKRKILKWVGFQNKRDFNYCMSYADRNLLNTYVRLKKYLENHNAL